MDKYEFNVIMEEIDSLIAERNFKEAARLADTIEWERVKSSSILCKISDLYKINRRYGDSLDLLEMAYEYHPSNRKIILSLCELELKLDNYIRALQLYNAFINVAPRDPDRYLLQYKLYKKQDVNAGEQIAVLESYLQRSFRDRWAYELAELYLRTGDEKRCIRQCDEIASYFGKGRFVVRALELKQSLTKLNPQQEELLEALSKGSRPGKAGDQETENPGADAAPQTEAAASGNAEAGPQAEGGASGEEEAGPRAEGTVSGQVEAASQAEVTGKSEKKIKKSSQEEADALHETEGSREKEVLGKEALGKETAEIKGTAEAVKPEEEYTDAILRDAKNQMRDANMQEMIARGMREIDEGETLPQESGGRSGEAESEEEPGLKPEEIPETANRIDLEQLMSEWEKIRRENEQQRLSEARRRILDRSAAARRQLYGDSLPKGGTPAAEGPEDAVSMPYQDVPEESAGDGGEEKGGSTRSWKRADVEKGLRAKQ